jgi:hypothetical protein
MPLDPEIRYTRTKDFESKVAGLELSPEVWSAFSLLEQPVNAREIAAALLVSVTVAQQALEALLAAGIVQPKAIGWSEFAQKPKSPIPAATRALGDAIVSIRIAPAAPRTPASVSLRLGAPPAESAAPAAVAVKGWKLRPALDAIGAAAGGGIPGQLLICKVFLLIPPDILKGAGVESVSSVGPDFVLTDTRLRDTLVQAARVHASVDLSPFFTS